MKTNLLYFYSKQRGVTLVEALIVVAIIGILAAMAAPSFNDYIDRERVIGAAEGVAAAMQNTKAEAIKSNSKLWVVFDSDAWCYGSTKAGDTTCDCTTANSCAIGSVVQGSEFPGVSVTFSNGVSTSFSPLRGTAHNGTITFSGNNGKTLNVVVSTLGRIKICTPSGSSIPGYEPCS